jgi:hypothetical protein
MNVNYTHAWCLRRSEAGVRSDTLELEFHMVRCWDSNLGPLDGQLVLLTTGLSLQPKQLSLITLCINGGLLELKNVMHI